MRTKKNMPKKVAAGKMLLYFLVMAFVSFSSAFAADPVPAAVAPEGEVNGDPNFITLDFKEADINTVLRVLSLKSKVNIVAGPEVKGTVTIRLENVPWEKALEVVLRTYDYVYERDENIIRVTTRDKMAQEPVVTQTIILNYSKATEIEAAVRDMLTERGRIKTAERTNTIVITDIPTNLYRIVEVIKKLDKRTPQAFIDSKIVRTALGETENLGIEWRTGGDNALGSISGANRPTTFPFATNTDDNREDLGQFFEQFLPINATGTNYAINADDLRAFPRPALPATAPTWEYGQLDFSSFSAILQMLKSRSNTKVVSNPS